MSLSLGPYFIIIGLYYLGFRSFKFVFAASAPIDLTGPPHATTSRQPAKTASEDAKQSLFDFSPRLSALGLSALSSQAYF